MKGAKACALLAARGNRRTKGSPAPSPPALCRLPKERGVLGSLPVVQVQRRSTRQQSYVPASAHSAAVCIACELCVFEPRARAVKCRATEKAQL